MFQPTIAPLGNLWLSALAAAIPLFVIFITLGMLKWKAHHAGLTAMGSAILVAVLIFRMPIHFALLSASEGAVFGIFPIAFIVLAAIWMYQITVVSGRFDDLRATFNLISDDPRVLAILIAFCFGGLLEALAGFGAPVAITAVMLMSLGYSKIRAAVTVLVANTAPVAFGAVATPVITAGKITGIPYTEIGAIAGRQTAVLAMLVPFFLLAIVDGKRGLKQVWPAALVIGFCFAAAKWITSNYISVELTDVVASLVGICAGVIMMRLWKPRGRAKARASLMVGAVTDPRSPYSQVAVKLTAGRIFMALVPYIIVVIIFSGAKLIKPVNEFLTSTDIKVGWPIIDGHILTASHRISNTTVYTFYWLSGAGTLLVITGIIVALIYRVSAKKCLAELVAIAKKLKYTFATMSCILGLAYVMNMSGMVVTIGTLIAGSGTAFAFFSPILGWLGTAVTGSDTSANALFASLQQAVANQTGIQPSLLVAANTTGGVVGKLISPQNIAIVASAVGLVGKESRILRRTFWWSVVLLVFMCILVGLQSTPILSWMLP